MHACQASGALVMRFRIPASRTELLQQESEWHNVLEESKYEVRDADVPGEAGLMLAGLAVQMLTLSATASMAEALQFYRHARDDSSSQESHVDVLLGLTEPYYPYAPCGPGQLTISASTTSLTFMTTVFHSAGSA